MLFASVVVAQAQEYRKGFLETMFDTDTTYIEPQRYNWTVMGQGSYVYDRFTMDFGGGDKMVVSSDPAFKVGPFAGYKFLFLGYTIDVKNLFKSKNRTDFVLGLYTNALGLDLFYRKVDGDFKVRDYGFKEDEADQITLPKSSDCRALQTKYIGFDMYYVLNHKHYSMPAVFAQSTVQRKSAGSPTLGIGYMNTKIDFDYTSFFTDLLSDIMDEAMMKANDGKKLTDEEKEFFRPFYEMLLVEALEGEQVLRNANYNSISTQLGYGYNWVFARNWAVGAHLSLNPSLKFNSATIMTYGKGSEKFHQTSFNLDYTGRAGIVYNNSRWYAGLNAVYYSSGFKMDEVKVRNNFGSVNLYVGINFGKK